MTGAIVTTRLVPTVINIDVTLFAGVSRLTGAQKVINEVCTSKIAFAGVRLTLIDFFTILKVHRPRFVRHGCSRTWDAGATFIMWLKEALITQ